MKFRLLPIFFLINICYQAVQAQNQQAIDSLKTVLVESENDAEKTSTLLELTDQLINNTPNEALAYAIQALEIAEQINLTKAISASLNKISNIHLNKGEFKLAMTQASRALKVAEKNNHVQEIIIAQKNIGFIYNKLGDYAKSSKYFFICLKLSEEFGDDEQIASSLNSIGYSYFDQKNYEKALEYYMRSLDIAREANIKNSIASGLNNVAAALGGLGYSEQYRSYVMEAIRINKEIGHSRFLAINYLNLGNYFKNEGIADSSFYYFQNALNLAQEIENTPLELRVRINMASLNYDQGNIDKSLSEALFNLQIAQEKGYKKDIYYTSNLLEKIYTLNNDFENVMKYNYLGSAVKDSLDLNDKQTELSKLELIYEFEKNEQEQKANQKRKDLIYLLIGITLLFILALVLFSLRQHKMKSKISNLEKHKLLDEIDIKNKELTSNVMSLMKKNEMINTFSSQLLEIEQDAVKDKTKKSIRRISKELRKSVESEILGEFEIRFNQVHVEFYDKLLKQFPDLSPNEHRLCAFLRLNMSSKEISELTGQRIETLDTARWRLRKKLNITNTKTNLVTFLSEI